MIGSSPVIHSGILRCIYSNLGARLLLRITRSRSLILFLRSFSTQFICGITVRRYADLIIRIVRRGSTQRVKGQIFRGPTLHSSSRVPNHLFSCPLRHLVFAVYQWVPNQYSRCEFVPRPSRTSRCHRSAPQTNDNFPPDFYFYARICRVPLTHAVRRMSR